jgi:hypothetical protein
VVATADLHRRDYFKPDFFNGIGQNRKQPSFRLAPKPVIGRDLHTLRMSGLDPLSAAARKSICRIANIPLVPMDHRLK